MSANALKRPRLDYRMYCGRVRCWRGTLQINELSSTNTFKHARTHACTHLFVRLRPTTHRHALYCNAAAAITLARDPFSNTWCTIATLSWHKSAYSSMFFCAFSKRSVVLCFWCCCRYNRWVRVPTLTHTLSDTHLLAVDTSALVSQAWTSTIVSWTRSTFARDHKKAEYAADDSLTVLWTSVIYVYRQKSMS